ncbi:MAG: (2E,6E)-farnesyl diphosphate synthase, partial [Gammaproteobacteria bacterium]|nr:(2E,6E)-farnesyl diphosphate synthase [Gammaproteobacteria bacterium]
MELKRLLSAYQMRIEAALQQWLPNDDEAPARLHAAMRYASLDGGKRVRPVLVYATGAALGVPLEQLDGPACAIEFIHAYSLVHDDLPAMDNDELRRGKPTCHRAFDEPTAILAGDALQSLAFEILARDNQMVTDPTLRLAMAGELACASGSRGMAGGQAIDIAAEGTRLTLEQLQTMHRYKTGALIRASVRLGALSSPHATAEQRAGLDRYAGAVGLAFQIRDDILDVEADTETLGKPQGSDQARGKPTYTSLLGLDGAKEK